MATTKVHWGKPIWVTSGGAELPVTNMAAALAVALAGPGDYSLDKALGVRLPRRLVLIPGLLLAAVGVATGLIISTRPQPQPELQPQPQPEEERPEAVPVPERPAVAALERREEQVEQTPDLVSGAELQAGQEAEHPV
jgi:hypothetical protein